MDQKRAVKTACEAGCIKLVGSQLCIFRALTSPLTMLAAFLDQSSRETHYWAHYRDCVAEPGDWREMSILRCLAFGMV